MRILLLGANGQLGTDLRRALPGEVVGLDWPELDVQQEGQVRAAIEAAKPAVVINCAAQTNVDACEDEPAAAIGVNTLGALHTARWAERSGAAVVYISTDYVFGAAGPRQDGYTEEDMPGPLNVYGASKLAGEHVTLAYNARSLVVRTCGLYGHAGARGKGGNFVETMLRLARERKAIRVVNDQRLSPTATADCAAKLCELVERKAVGLYHVAAQDSCTWFEFAREIFAHERLDVAVQPIRTSEYPVRARRPEMSALRSIRLEAAGMAECRPWRAMLHDYLRRDPAQHFRRSRMSWELCE